MERGIRRILVLVKTGFSQAFFEGELGLPKDPARARYWLKKIVDDECEYKHFNNKWMAKSAEMLRELDA